MVDDKYIFDTNYNVRLDIITKDKDIMRFYAKKTDSLRNYDSITIYKGIGYRFTRNKDSLNRRRLMRYDSKKDTIK